MKRALTLATGLTIGYVAGTRAGREKYELIKGKMQEVSRQPAVVEMRDNVQGQVGTAAKAVADKATDVASGLSKKIRAASGDEAAASHQDTARPAPGEYPAAPTGVIPGSVPGSGAL